MLLFDLLASTTILLYPLASIGHPTITRVISATLITAFSNFVIGSQLVSSLCSTSMTYILGFILTIALSAVNFLFPMTVVVITAATCGGLVTSKLPTSVTVCVSIATGMGILLSRSLVVNWQLFCPPIVGGFLMARFIASFLSNNAASLGLVFVALWIVVGACGFGLQVQTLRSLHIKRQQEAEDVADRHYKMFNESSGMVSACMGDREQLDRVLFGAGLY